MLQLVHKCAFCLREKYGNVNGSVKFPSNAWGVMISHSGLYSSHHNATCKLIDILYKSNFYNIFSLYKMSLA